MKRRPRYFFFCSLILTTFSFFPLLPGEETTQSEKNQIDKQTILKNLNKTISIDLDNVPAIKTSNKATEDTGTELRVTAGGLLACILAKDQNLNQQKSMGGKIKGQVLDSETKEPLLGVSVELTNIHKEAATDKNGFFTFQNIPVGNYTVVFSYPGFEKLSMTDVIVRPKRITTVHAELKLSPIMAPEVVVTARYFNQKEEQLTINASFSAEEVRQTPSLLCDVSRTLIGLPSVVNMNKHFNGLIVRGGSPFENGFFIDGIKIPNINHFPIQGSSEGMIGIMNVDFIENINFYAGGFPTVYGDSLSSVVDLTLREGNRNEFDFKLDLNLAGVGGIVEGSLGKGKGSWLFAARRSLIGFLVDITKVDDGTDYPEYNDFQGKLVYDLSPNHRISILNIFSADEWNRPRRYSKELYSGVKITQNTVGVSWRYLWGRKGYSNTSISHSFSRHNIDFNLAETDEPLFIKNAQDQEFRLRNINCFRINPSHKLIFGVEAKLLKSEFNDFYCENYYLVGSITPEMILKKDILTQKYAAFINYSWKLSDKLTLTPGVRLDHFAYNKNTHISPRFSFTYRISNKTSLQGATGIYYQYVPMVLLYQNDGFKNLKNPRAYHYILGVHHLFTENTRMTIEIFKKQYDHFPLDPTQPAFFIMDEPGYRFYFFNHEHIVDSGVAQSHGIEIMIQKKLAHKFYGLLGGAFYRSGYKDFYGVWRNRIYDNLYNATIEVGYDPNPKWEFSMRWLFAGGMPYTPFDVAASQKLGYGILDVNKINSQRLPDHNSLSIRFERCFQFSGSNLIFSFSVWNVFNKRTPNYYEWSSELNIQFSNKGFPRILVLGLEFEF